MRNLCFTVRPLQFSEIAHKSLGKSVHPSPLFSSLWCFHPVSHRRHIFPCLHPYLHSGSPLSPPRAQGAGGRSGSSCCAAARVLAAARLAQGRRRAGHRRTARRGWRQRLGLDETQALGRAEVLAPAGAGASAVQDGA
jgi:hypothetical protein